MKNQKIHFPLSKMTQYLRLQESFNSVPSLIPAHLSQVEKLFLAFLSSEQGVFSALKQELRSLPEESMARLTTSPYLCEALMILAENAPEAKRFIPTLKKQIAQAIVAEIKIVHPNYQHPLCPTWSVNGDTIFDDEIKHKFPPVFTNCGLFLNYQSSNHNTGQEGIGGYDHSTCLKHKERIETAKSIIERTSLPALSLVDSFTTMIQFRQNTIRPNVVNSSTHTSIGLIRCDNFHKLHNDMPEIVDMLVHESIHQYLHLYEEQIESFIAVEALPPELVHGRRFPSPWSGNLLDIRSYTHAILVWYGLVYYWSQYITSGAYSDEITLQLAQQKLSEAKYGFENSNSVLDNLGDSIQYLNPQYRDVIIALQAEIGSLRRAV